MKRYEQGTLGMQTDKQGAWCEYEEANAKIERLRDQVTRLSTLVDTERSLHDSEVERLREERRALLNVRTTEGLLASEWLLRTATAEAEVERLQKAHDHQYEVANTMLREAERVSRENERLRELLLVYLNE